MMTSTSATNINLLTNAPSERNRRKSFISLTSSSKHRSASSHRKGADDSNHNHILPDNTANPKREEEEDDDVSPVKRRSISLRKSFLLQQSQPNQTSLISPSFTSPSPSNTKLKSAGKRIIQKIKQFGSSTHTHKSNQQQQQNNSESRIVDIQEICIPTSSLSFSSTSIVCSSPRRTSGGVGSGGVGSGSVTSFGNGSHHVTNTTTSHMMYPKRLSTDSNTSYNNNNNHHQHHFYPKRLSAGSAASFTNYNHHTIQPKRLSTGSTTSFGNTNNHHSSNNNYYHPKRLSACSSTSFSNNTMNHETMISSSVASVTGGGGTSGDGGSGDCCSNDEPTNIVSTVLSDETPQAFLDNILKSRGYSVQRYNTLECAYYNDQPTELQKASYGVRIIEMIDTPDEEGLESCLLAGIHSNPCDEYGESILHRVCRYGDMNLLDVLMDNDCIVQCANDFGSTPLHEACKCTKLCFPVIETLLLHDPYLLYMADATGKVPLEYVIPDQWYEYMLFLESRIDRYWPATMRSSSSSSSLNSSTTATNNHKEIEDYEKIDAGVISSDPQQQQQPPKQEKQPPLTLEKPGSRIPPDPTCPLSTELAWMVGSGVICPEEAVSYMDETVLRKFLPTIHQRLNEMAMEEEMKEKIHHNNKISGFKLGTTTSATGTKNGECSTNDNHITNNIIHDSCDDDLTV